MTIAKQIFGTIPIVIYTQKNFYLLEEINEGIMQIMAAGLTDVWQYNDRKHTEIESSREKVIKLSHLIGCFQLFVMGLIIAVIVFILEVVWSKLSPRERQLS
jgi:hypothetical protein